MWKVLLAFTGHRILLLATALFVINAKMPEGPNRPTVTDAFLAKVAQLPESGAVSAVSQETAGRVFRVSSDPYLWIAALLMKVGRTSGAVALIVLSNIFCIFFLWELNCLLNRMAMPDTAAAAAILAVLWPASYELSLGSSFSAVCLCAAGVFRHALDNRWLVAGLYLGAFILLDVTAIAFVPLLAYLFWYYQRHFLLPQVLRRTAFFLVPLALALYARGGALEGLRAAFHASALFDLRLVNNLKAAGQTVALVFLVAGAVFAALEGTMLLHKIIAAVAALVVVATTPYLSLASRALLAGTSFQGVAGRCSRPALNAVQGLLLVASLYEIYAVFS